MSKIKRIFRSPYFWMIVVLIIIVRAFAPSIILKQTNTFLGSFSETYKGHIEDLDIQLIRGAYQLEGFSLVLKKFPSDKFVYINNVDVSIAWREIFSGRINTDIIVDKAKLVITKNVTNAFSKNEKGATEDSKKAAGKLFPVRVGRVDIQNSQFEFAELLSIPEAERWRLTKVNGRISNVTPTESTPLTLATLRGALFDSSDIKVVANLNTLRTPSAWDVDVELRDFNLANANAWLKRKLPLSFTSGKLNLYSEVRYEGKKMEGYVKPFFHKADIVANNEIFSGFKHLAIEVSAAVANLFFRSAREKTLATKVLFSYENGEFNINSSKVLSEAFKNGFSEKIPEGIDDEISLSKKNLTITRREVNQ